MMVGMISGPFQSKIFHRHYVEPRVELYVPREESFTISLKYLDVTRATDTSMDVMLETSTSLDVMLEKISTIIGTLIEIENFSQDSRY